MILTDNNDELIFEEDGVEEETETITPWKMMIVDDVEDIHHVTRMIFDDYVFDGRSIEFLSAYSGKEARELTVAHPDTAVILLDVVMETDHAGLEVVQYIREELKNKIVRIILRTGQPGEAPEKKVIIAYDINDYKTKEELTSNRLFSTVTSALRSYRDMTVIEKNRQGLEMIIHASSSLLKLQSLKQFTAGVLTQLTSILGFEENSLLVQTANGTCGFAATEEHGNYKIIAGTGRYEQYLDRCVTDLGEEQVSDSVSQVLSRKQSIFNEKNVVCYFKTHNNIENILYLQSQQPVNTTDRNLIDIFLSNVAIAFDNLYHRENLARLVEERTFALEQEKETVARAHKLLAKYVPPQLTERILADEIDDVWDYARRRLTLFFSDIKDFTNITELMEPEDMANLLNEYLSEMYEIANEFGGVVANVKGDELFIFFGAPDKRADQDNALRCVQMAVAMQRRMGELKEKWYNEGMAQTLKIRCGINTGMVNVGGFGSKNRKDYTAFGMHVNLASRLEGICDPGGILVSHATWALVKDDFQFETEGEVAIKGFSHPVLAHNLRSADIPLETQML
jgi:class 3 adenylate cyclase/CheY-like chemotaxis protein